MQFPLQNNISLKELNTFKVGGQARYFCLAQNPEDLRQALSFAKNNDIKPFVLGKGSNLVISDTGYAGLIIQLGEGLSKIEVHNNQIKAGAGALWNSVVSQSVKAGLGGIEHMAGIPGTVGGGVFINAGAFGQEICQTLILAKSLNPQGEIVERSNSQCEFAYRHSLFCELDEIILEAQFELSPAPPQVLHQAMTETLIKRKSKQPLHLPNAGSMYKRPPGSYAGLHIEQAGLKGFKMGQAQVSDLHANFIVNLGGATAQEIYNLSEEVIRRVEESQGVRLQKEVLFLGKFEPWPS
jgi:UDP-N-acetylmuramate dehydrogenase